MRAHHLIAVASVVALLGIAALGCPRGRPLASGVHVGRVAGVVPYSMSDQWGEQPESAFLCLSDRDCETVAVRECCGGCSTAWLAVNHAAARAIARHHETHPCPQASAGCPDEECDPPASPPEPPLARCVAERCSLVAG